jgi:hypothetical protein
MLHNKVNKDSENKQYSSVIQVKTSRYQSKRDDNGNDMKSISMSMQHHSPRKSTKKTSCKFKDMEQPKCGSYLDAEEKA